MSSRKEYARNYYLLHKKETIERSKKRSIEKRTEIETQRRKRRKKNHYDIIKHYSDEQMSCRCCGENVYEFLVIDHINGGGNKHRRELGKQGGDSFYAWLLRNNFPEGFQVLCHNCNWAKTRYGACPHTKL